MDDITAIETITHHCYRSFAGFPGAVVIDDESLYAVISHVQMPFFSGVARTNLAADEVEPAFGRLRAKGSPFRWWVTPSTRPAGLGETLVQLGMRHAYDAPGMIADLMQVPLGSEDPTIRRVGNADDLEQWLDVFMPVFHPPAERRAAVRDAYVRCGFGDDAAWQHFVAFDGEVPVATTSVLIAGDLSGIYFVGTLPAARGRGIGSAVTRAAMRCARDAGATRAALQSSESGYRVYEGLGFVNRCTVSAYDWS
jgi:GNAT superfamily N-acetyltransferase